MDVAFDLVSREAAMLVAISLIGSGPATLLRTIAKWPVRLALMPAIGLCLATSILTSLAWFFPASSTFWVLLVLASWSCVAAWLLVRRGPHTTEKHLARTEDADRKLRRNGRVVGALQCLVVTVAVAGPVTLTLIEAHSVGPVAYQVYDAADYLAMQDALQHQSIRAAETTALVHRNLVQNVFTALVDSPQETEMSPLAANMNELLGLNATDTQSAYLIALLTAGGLGLFGAIGLAAGKPSWWAVFGGCLFGGGLLMQLFFDGSEGAICGLVVLVPLGVTSIAAVKGKSIQLFVPPAIMLSGLFALYPVFVGVVGGAGAIVIGLMALRPRVLRHPNWHACLRMGAIPAAAVTFAVVLDLEGFLRAWQVWRVALRKGLGSVGFPQYYLALRDLPGWLLQTVGFYSFATTPQSDVGALAALAVPLFVAVVIFPVLRRNVFAWIVVAGIAIAVVGAHHQAAESCAYCEDRNLLPIGVLLMFLVGLGAVLLAVTRPRLTLGVVLVLSGFVAYSSYNENARYANGSYFLTESVRSVVAAIPIGSGVVDLEGFDAGPRAPGELPFVYDLVYEHNQHRVSVPLDQASDPGSAYEFVHPLDGSLGEIFNPDYEFVLTRLPSVSTNRSMTAMLPGIALERRSSRLDVTVDGGLAVPTLPAENPEGYAYVVNAIRFLVTGTRATTPSVRFEFALPSGLSATDLATLRSVGAISDSTLSGCVATTRKSVFNSEIHIATVSVPPNIGIRLTMMKAIVGGCPSK